jgi:hypothetical protein
VETVVIIHGPDHLDAAYKVSAERDRPISAITAAWAGASYGALYWSEAEAAARKRWPAAEVTLALHCLDDAGRAMAALRMGWKRLIFTADEPIRRKILEQAAAVGAEVLPEPAGPVLDLAEHPDPATALAALDH